ncbi:hypothetical protein RclHR1_01370019 [Rhizophagus clarus]|uniref:F-box domain-containing protein n=1 Tax=Rhizophagus clarus TaxID=94130 RepID=A0A2Z6QAT2_9GLOM|nr:hypothetical protein RclHR1_01370019 [Rhizophagus clarus]GES77314.1 hypothetical protein GLOIN_2v1784964 [Rhizophagus clarus]
MFKLDGDVLYLIIKEFQNDRRMLNSCLKVNKTWCETTIPILWKDPWKYHLEEKSSLCRVILSHLSDEAKVNLKNYGFDFLKNIYKRPLIDYINCCRNLNLNALMLIINTDDYISPFSKYNREILEKEIIKLFINKNTKFTHLYLPSRFNHQIPGAELCFSELEFINISTFTHDNVLVSLQELFKPVRKLELVIEKDNNNYGIIKLIENSKKLISINFITKNIAGYSTEDYDKAFRNALENSIIKHGRTMQYFKIDKPPVMNILSNFINLKVLKISGSEGYFWGCLKNISLPYLRILKAESIPIKYLAILIDNTGGCLSEIVIDGVNHNECDNKIIIQSIYKKCPKLRYLKIQLRNENISDFEKILINCKYLDGLHCVINNDFFHDDGSSDVFNWDYLFEVFYKSSPFNFYKIKLIFTNPFELESLKSFLEGWKGRPPLLLHTIQTSSWGYNIDLGKEYLELIKKYKSKGIVKRYIHAYYELNPFKDFEWIRENQY